ncbi:MAG: S4 domain-containing protein, partial [Pseudobdellovibrionaceae bacterium]|nr:S4 domain-containing protein [Pseudobdellovibrionaceae bacterium]
MRLNKFLAQCGIASRRKADQLISQGLVTINGRKVYELGIQVNPDLDRVVVDGKPVTIPKQKIYLAFYKPRQVMTTMSDPQGRPCVADYLKHMKTRVFPVGRLDWTSEGLLLLTNDGDWAQKI